MLITGNNPLTDQPLKETAGIYLHIPFCKQACVYCNFHFSTSLKYKDGVIQAMVKEIELQRDYLSGKPISTIYIGGGTPSLLSADEINILTETISKYHDIHSLTEFTLEANPDDLSKEYLRGLKNTSVTRLSIGVQSFRDEDLLYMKRAHNASEADYCIKAAQDTGFTNLSIDLIYGIPGLSDSQWKKHISMVAALSIPHFSAYALTVEEHTPLAKSIMMKRTSPVDAGQAATQFELLMEYSKEKGFDHYEISNLALPGHYAIHNTNYWLNHHYLGIGPSAHSFNGHSRRWNVSNNNKYTEALLRGYLPVTEEETLTRYQQLNEYIMTSLRTMWGMDMNKIKITWGNEYYEMVDSELGKQFRQGNMERNNETITLTTRGKLYADKIAGDLFVTERR